LTAISTVGGSAHTLQTAVAVNPCKPSFSVLMTVTVQASDRITQRKVSASTYAGVVPGFADGVSEIILRQFFRRAEQTIRAAVRLHDADAMALQAAKTLHRRGILDFVDARVPQDLRCDGDGDIARLPAGLGREGFGQLQEGCPR